MPTQQLIDRLFSCPKGQRGWRQFEDICIEILKFLFVPPLRTPRTQSVPRSGVERRDAVFPNWVSSTITVWDQLRTDFRARFILFEFKNHKKQKVSSTEVDQVRNYLNPRIGNLGIIISTQGPSRAALKKRDRVFADDGKLVLFLTPKNLREMIFIRERGEDPANLIMDMIDTFLLKHG